MYTVNIIEYAQLPLWGVGLGVKGIRNNTDLFVSYFVWNQFLTCLINICDVICSSFVFF